MQKLKMHPDLGGDATLASELNVAYATLSDPNKRAAYDQTRGASVDQTSQPETPQSSRRGTNAPRSNNDEKPNKPRIMWDGQIERLATECLFCRNPHSFGGAPSADTVCDLCGCPLANAGSRSLVEGERRALERLQLERVISFRTSHTAAALTTETKDLSLTGMKFQARMDLVVNQLVQINSQFCLALARVAHATGTDQAGIQAQPVEFGVEFVTLSFPTPSGSLISTRA